MINGYSICLNEWALDKEISSDLGLLLIISSLTAEKGYCYAGNEYFSKLFKINEVSVSRKIKKLEEKGYITIDYEKRGNQITKRIIRLTKMLTDHYQKSQPTVNKNVKGNNTSMNNISIIKDIVAFLNKKCKTSFKDTSKKTISLVNARLSEGFKEEDFKTVINFKSREWLGNDKMEQYLRPETLFGTKFEGYLNDAKRKSSNKNNKEDYNDTSDGFYW